MTIKYSNRETDSNKKKQNRSSDDEWDSIDESNKNSNIQDMGVVPDKGDSLNTEQEKIITNWDKTKDATRNALDRAGNTSQYMKYVNEHFQKKHSEIDRIKQLHEKFNQDINLLKNIPDDSMEESKLPSRQNIQKLIDIKNSLLKEKGIKRLYLNQLKNEIFNTEKNLQNLDRQLRDIENQMINRDQS